MPNIPQSKFTTSSERTSLGRESMTASPKSIGITQAPPSTSTVKKPIKTFPGVRVGLRAAHNVELFDLSANKAQYLPFLVHCSTCAFEGRLATMDEATGVALVHAGK